MKFVILRVSCGYVDKLGRFLNLYENVDGTTISLTTAIFVEKCLKPTWDWMFSVLDGTESQLKFGAYLTNHTDPSHPLHPLNLSSQNTISQSNSSTVGVNLLGSSNRREFFTYCLSLMRAHSSEHRDALPVLDITALRHIAYVLDGFIYYLRNDTRFYDKSDTELQRNTLGAEIDDTDDELSNLTSDDPFIEINSNANQTTTKRHSFFTRSDSTLSLGFIAPEGFSLPLDAAIPLADKPHLLQPNSKREELFANLPLVIYNKPRSEHMNTANITNILDYPPTSLAFSNYTNKLQKVVKNTLSESLEYPSTSAFEARVYIHDEKKQFENENQITNATNTLTEHNNLNVIKVEHDSNVYKLNPSEQALISTRPDVIITPTKAGKGNTEGTLLNESKSIMRSVIVRAGAVSKKADEYGNIIQDEELKCNSRSKILTNLPMRGFTFCTIIPNDSPLWNMLLGRWKLSLDLFGRVFMDDVGMESGSVLPELRGFPVKETRFRRHMEKLRNGQQRDLILCKLERNRESLILQTFKELNTQFGSQNRRVHPPLTFNRVKVTFKDEPGEGSGVARSFYTSISEALLASVKMPNLDSVQVGNNSKYCVPFLSTLRNRGSSSRDPPSLQRRGTGSKILWRSARERKILNYEARPYTPLTENSSESLNDHLSIHLQQLGERLYPKIHSISPVHATKITGMLLEIPTPQLLPILSSEETLRQKVSEALEIITLKQKAEGNATINQSKKMIPVVLLEQCQFEDNDPLFYSPGKRGFYTPRQGYGSFERINAFRNIGRLIGLCLLQNELLPLFLQRHVLKYILGRKIKFHDLAFFDPTIYESFRQLIQNSQSTDGEDCINRMELYFVIDLLKEEGGGNVELLPGGREIQVTAQNIFDYIKRYTEYRLIKSQEKSLEALKDGVFDVLPDSCMNNLTAEDLRLLLNGVGDINVSTLISYTTFNDESSEGSDKLLKFKRWFWSIVEKMNIIERQDLVYFWTGSPALPASEEGFQPLPSVTIRPADDSHLPTANTCISRLYIPLYSSKSILRCKLLLAIKSKNFGFV